MEQDKVGHNRKGEKPVKKDFFPFLFCLIVEKNELLVCGLVDARAAVDAGGKPEKTELVLAYPQASGVFTPIFVADDAIFSRSMVSTSSSSSSIRSFRCNLSYRAQRMFPSRPAIW